MPSFALLAVPLAVALAPPLTADAVLDRVRRDAPMGTEGCSVMVTMTQEQAREEQDEPLTERAVYRFDAEAARWSLVEGEPLTSTNDPMERQDADGEGRITTDQYAQMLATLTEAFEIADIADDHVVLRHAPPRRRVGGVLGDYSGQAKEVRVETAAPRWFVSSVAASSQGKVRVPTKARIDEVRSLDRYDRMGERAVLVERVASIGAHAWGEAGSARFRRAYSDYDCPPVD